MQPQPKRLDRGNPPHASATSSTCLCLPVETTQPQTTAARSGCVERVARQGEAAFARRIARLRGSRVCVPSVAARTGQGACWHSTAPVAALAQPLLLWLVGSCRAATQQDSCRGRRPWRRRRWGGVGWGRVEWMEWMEWVEWVEWWSGVVSVFSSQPATPSSSDLAPPTPPTPSTPLLSPPNTRQRPRLRRSSTAGKTSWQWSGWSGWSGGGGGGGRRRLRR